MRDLEGTWSWPWRLVVFHVASYSLVLEMHVLLHADGTNLSFKPFSTSPYGYRWEYLPITYPGSAASTHTPVHRLGGYLGYLEYDSNASEASLCIGPAPCLAVHPSVTETPREARRDPGQLLAYLVESQRQISPVPTPYILRSPYKKE